MSKPKDPWDRLKKGCVIRREAIKRNPLYRQEFDAAFDSYRGRLPKNRAVNSSLDLIESFRPSDEAQKFCHRWSLAFALHPDDQLWDFSPEDAPVFFKDPGNAVNIVPHGKPKFIPEEGRMDFTPQLRDGRYLRLDIDLKASKTQIEAKFAYWLKKYQDLIINDQVLQQLQDTTKIPSTPFPDANLPVDQWIAERNKQEEQGIAEIREQVEEANAYRRRRQSLDIYLDEEPPSGPITIFQVWDMKNKEKKTPWQIVKQLYPVKVNGKSYQPYAKNFDHKAKSLKKLIEDAINRADKIIGSITPDP